MKIKGVRQVDLANYLGLSKTSITQWKAHSSKSYMKYLDELAEYFDVTKDDLIHADKSNIYASHLSQTEQELVNNFRLLTKEKQSLISQLVKVSI